MQNNLTHHTDWIVLNQSITTLARWAKIDQNLKKWLQPHLERLAADSRNSVAKTALKFTKMLY